MIRQIMVSGNTRTQEKIVHRNSGLEAGTPYDPEAILDAQRQLYATGLFNRVDIVPLNRPASGERDLLIQLEDAGPVVLTYGVGAQDREGIRGTVEVTHSNLWGLDRSISTRIRGSRREQRFQTTYREPRLFNWELDGFASLFMERARQTAFDASRVDFSFQSLKQFANRDNLLLSVSYQTVNLRDIRDNRRTEEFPTKKGSSRSPGWAVPTFETRGTTYSTRRAGISLRARFSLRARVSAPRSTSRPCLPSSVFSAPQSRR